MNVCKKKHLTNMRNSTAKKRSGWNRRAFSRWMTRSNFWRDDELLEITPKHFRLRKRILNKSERDRVVGKK